MTEGAPAPESAAAEATATEAGTSALLTPAEVAPAAEAEGPAGGTPAGTEEPPQVIAVGGEVAAGVPPAASAATSVQVPGPSVNPAASSAMVPTSTAASGSAPTSASVPTIPKVWRASVLCWSSCEDPPRHLFTLDDAAEWHKWQAVQGSLAHAQAALSSALGVLGNTVLPGSQGPVPAKSLPPRESSVTCKRREGAALDEARRSEAKLQAVIDKARLDQEESRAAIERARRDAEELARPRGEYEALQKTVERVRRERYQALQDRDAERAKKEEAEQGLQTAVSRGADQERELKAWADDESSFRSRILMVSRFVF
ncbi:uncharacterized protein LOC105914188 [Setaria italica]|uniref:uncharacterized protein LOC105914188 n=1 Tax=Setaria italica TaxID=4555 RepID=UPI000648A315|nr:uncharacterized protein LOC105914188 [Setaria italica]